MTRTAYQRINTASLAHAPAGAAARADHAQAAAVRVRWLVIPLSILLCVLQAIITLLANNVSGVAVTSTLIPVFGFGVLVIVVLMLNPILRVLGAVTAGLLRPLNRPELVCIFAAMMCTAGISAFGLTEQLIPIIATPFNPEWNTPQKGWNDNLTPNMMNSGLYLTDPEVVRVFRGGVHVKAPLEGAPLAERASYWMDVARATPWHAWAGPVSYWLVFIFATYGMFYCLTYVVLGYWAQREKLIFPLAQLPIALMPDDSKGLGRVPLIFKSPGFWLGFTISAGVLAWNAMVAAGWLPGLTAIGLGMGRQVVTALLSGSMFTGITGGNDYATMFIIIFTAVGIAFLLPLEISFSIWFYFVVGRAIILVHTWLGYGQTEANFPTDWLWLNSPVTAQGGGGFLFFSLMALYRCMKDYIALARGKSVGERLKIAIPVIGLVICILIMTLWLAQSRIGFWWALVMIGFVTLMTVGMMRIVAEGGVYWLQAHTSFFHVYKMLGLGRYFHNVSPALVGPLLPIYSVLFLDIKTFMAPNLLNAGEMQRVTSTSRGKFHLNLAVCIVVSVFVSLAFAIFLAHMRGAQQMEGWFYSQGPLSLMSTAYDATTAVPKFDPTTTAWYGVGAAWVALSLWLRTAFFWFPHPVGYIMLINPLMSQLWFSFFIGWIAKKIVVKFGGKQTFDRVRDIFIGLIMGELLSIFFWGAVSLIFNIKTGNITLNRY
ncbi:MAG: hypothetical protein K8S99_17210 [Planctomycetes bacterium]|nr:hypothetical protein [Planctomycetota bacterium]